MACLIPTFDQLLAQLGYDINSSDLFRSRAFKDRVEEFIRQHVSREGQKGTEFRNWQVHQQALCEMAEAFLEERGDSFWPDDNRSLFANRLKHTTNYRQIHKLMVQLFFRYNDICRPTSLGEVPGPVMDGLDLESQYQAITSGLEDQDAQQQTVRFTYSVSVESGSYFELDDWHPNPNFHARSLAELLSEVPGGETAAGIRVIFKGPGVYICRYAFTEYDFETLVITCNDRINQCLAAGRYDRLAEKTFHTEIQLLEEDHIEPASSWAFGRKP